MDGEKQTAKYLRRLKQLETQRSEWDDQWKDLSEFILPRKGRFASRGDIPNEGRRKGTKIIDSTATRAVRILAAGMQGGLTSPARPWFRLGMARGGAERAPSVRVWLSETERIIYQVFARSNFYSSVHSIYTEEGVFGVSDLFVEADPDKLVRFTNLTVGEYAAQANAAGVVDTVYRRYFMTAGQMEEAFGRGKLSRHVRDSLKNARDTYFEVVHAVQPRRTRDTSKLDNLNMPWESLYFEYSGDNVLKTSGYHENPHMVVRWDVTGAEVYGRSPGMDLLGDVKQLQRMSKDYLLALALSLNPPMNVPAAFKETLNLVPGGVNYVPGQDMDAIRATYQVKADLRSTDAKIEKVQAAIKEGFFNDLFLMILNRPNMTATEVLERHEEKLLMLGPVIERQQSDLLDPLIDRVFGILARAGALPPPPQEIMGEEIKVEYISMLAQAQKMLGVDAIQKTSVFVGQMAQVKPEVLDIFDFDQAGREYAESIGVSPKLIRSEKDVAAIRQARAQAQAEQQRQLQIQQAAQGAKVLSETDTEGKNALTDTLQAMTGV